MVLTATSYCRSVTPTARSRAPFGSPCPTASAHRQSPSDQEEFRLEQSFNLLGQPRELNIHDPDYALSIDKDHVGQAVVRREEEVVQ